jgi:tRNA (guanosine-2'-O-)-methyltransferase
MRSAEALGFQKFHIIQNGDRFKVANRVTKGTDRWLEVKKWVTTSDWIKFIRDQGYRIAVTHLSDESIPIGEVDFSIPTAVVFGNEKDGISEEMVLKSDLSFVIPMSGFAQSFNISVAAAISLYHIVEDRRRRPGGHSDLSDLDKQELLAQYCLNTVTHGEQILLNSKETLPL